MIDDLEERPWFVFAMTLPHAAPHGALTLGVARAAVAEARPDPSKPQKWTPEHERWIALGRPLDLLEIEQLQEDAALADTEPPRDDEAAA